MTIFKRLFGNQTTGDAPEVALFIETMLLMIAADGQVDDREMMQFMHEVHSRPEFEGIDQSAVDQHIEEAFAALKADGVSKRVHYIASRLKDREHRIAATTMAVSIGLGDGQLGDSEATLLKILADAFALTGDEVTAIVTQARTLPQVSSTESDPTERLYIETMMLMAAADGEFDPSEVEVFADQFANHPAFAELLPQKAGAYMEEILALLEREGVDARLAAIAHGLEDEAQRQNAFSLALEVCMADGLADPYEKELLRILAEQLTLSEEFVDSQIKQAMGAGA